MGFQERQHGHDDRDQHPHDADGFSEVVLLGIVARGGMMGRHDLVQAIALLVNHNEITPDLLEFPVKIREIVSV